MMLNTQDKKFKRLFNSQNRHKYDGVLIHQDYDDDGAIEVIDADDGVRSLHFGSIPRQSSMLLSDPNQLYLEYARTMSSWLLFKETLNDDALLIGLGGGSIAKYLLHQFPDCQIKAVEYRKSVVKIARSHFGLPLDSRLKIVVDDGGEYVRKRLDSERALYSLIMVDAFDATGMADAICKAIFFENCQKLLKKDGMLVINCWGGVSRPQFQQIALWLGRLFNWKLLFVPVTGRGNIIGLAFNSGTPTYALRDLRTRAIVLEQLYQIEFTRFLRDLVKHNTSVLQNIIYK